ncbi:hypothetical protein EDWATA_01515 [Edwardsiella tarda ATCC 23685]|uniref:Uncharacterized protein n=1 Tax=Edwardsiella tarda ATCC 23685 TaxID=500638 RepID=D4F447_EDWTA|nr:hypothetical protein EDWATA_01515 [Edwardsiella tarda ATCC 23685]
MQPIYFYAGNIYSMLIFCENVIAARSVVRCLFSYSILIYLIRVIG